MKYVLAALVGLVLLTGCSERPRAKELGQVAVICTVGVDTTENGATLTAAADGPEGELLSASGPSVAAAALAVQEQGEQAVWYGHVERLVLGEDLARSGVGSVVDYLAREPQLGPGVELWVARGTAADALGTQRIAGRLEQMSARGTGTEACSAALLMSALARQGSVCVPAVERVGDGADKGVARAGYALIRQGKLVDWLVEDRALGYELLMGRGVGGIACVDTGAGVVSVALEENILRVNPEFRDGELVGLEVDCTLRGRIAQRERLLTAAQRKELELLYERVQAERLVAALELMQYWDADPAGLEQRAMLADPARKTDIDRQFEVRYRTLAIRVAVTARVEADGAVQEGSLN